MRNGSRWAYLINRLFSAVAQRSISGPRDRAGVRLFYDPNDVVGAGIAADGYFEAHLLEVLGDFLTAEYPDASRIIAVDAGANIGNHTLALRSKFSRIFAIECNPLVLHVLKANVLYNGASNIQIIERAVSDRSEVVRFSVNSGGNLGASHVAPDGGIEVESARLDDLILPNLTEGERVGFIKLDVEGYEAAALRGASEILRRHHPVVAFEVHAGKFSAISAELAHFGYNTYYNISRSGWGTEDSVIRKFMGLLWHGPGAEMLPLTPRADRFYDMIVAVARGSGDAEP